MNATAEASAAADRSVRWNADLLENQTNVRRDGYAEGSSASVRWTAYMPQL